MYAKLLETPRSDGRFSSDPKERQSLKYGSCDSEDKPDGLLSPHLPQSDEGPTKERRLSASVFMNGTHRPIDFILAFRHAKPQHEKIRQEFEVKLTKQGLELQLEGVEQSQDGKTCFIKIHAPWPVLARTAEINRIKMPIKVNDLDDATKSKSLLDRFFENVLHRINPFKIHYTEMGTEPEYFTAAFNRARVHQFLIKDKEKFFTPTQRIRMVWDIIMRTQVLIEGDSAPKDPVGIEWLVKERVYIAAYPLHDGDVVDKPNNFRIKSESFLMSTLVTDYESLEAASRWPMRRLLYESWARPRQCFRYQPLGKVRSYYGEKVAIYFAWLGFYTKMLVPPAIVGLICFIYGLGSHGVDSARRDICSDETGNTTIICRQCSDKICPFAKLQNSCLYASLTVVFDNASTVFFSLFMSIWAVVFLELWKRRQAELCWNWGVTDVEFEEESIRPEYQAAVKTRRINPITGVEEPYLPTLDKLHRLFTSIATVMFMVCIVLSFLSGIIFYRILGPLTRVPQIQEGALVAPILNSISAAVLNAIVILVLEKFYERLAWYLTEREFPRTDNDFETSYTYKVFIFQFINYYAALFYIAFLKGKIYGPPNETGIKDRCDPAGCLIDVCIQLAIIMVGKQLISNFIEIGYPMLQNWWRRRKNVEETENNLYTRWEKDFDLNPLPPLGLFEEYLEMIIQYGFVTMFVAAFPLAPVFALLNNIIEIRLDAFKLLTQFRRPVPSRAQSIGAWYTILEIVTKIAVITNGLVIAFTSDFIDRLVYQVTVNDQHTLNGYVLSLFSKFNTSDWTDESLAFDSTLGHVQTCSYRDYRNGPNSATPYTRSQRWWHVLVARLFFVLVFEHVVFLIQGFVEYIIPDVPEHVQVKIQRENFLAKQALYNYEFGPSLPAKARESANGVKHDMSKSVPRDISELSANMDNSINDMQQWDGTPPT